MMGVIIELPEENGMFYIPIIIFGMIKRLLGGDAKFYWLMCIYGVIKWLQEGNGKVISSMINWLPEQHNIL